MNALVVYYSRTGNSRKVAANIAWELNADLDEIVSLKNYKGIFGYIKAGYHALKDKVIQVKFIKKIENYGLVIIVSPNWGARMASPILSYLKLNDLSKKKIGICCVQGGSGGDKIIKRIEDFIGKKAKTSLIISQVDFKNKNYLSKINGFCNRIR